MDWTQGRQSSDLVVLQVKASSLAGLIGVVDRRHNGNTRSGTGVGRAQAVAELLEDIWAEIVLIDNGDVTSRALGADKLWSVGD